MNKTNVVTLSILCLSLVGCFENRKNTEQLCEDNPALQCQRLNVDDGQCRVPRTDLIWHRFERIKNPTPSNQIEEYNLLGKYKKCLELASQIQAIDQTELKERRFHALVNAGEDMEKVVAELKRSQTPEALYFLWSRTGSDSARRQFLQLEGSPELDTAEMQYALATFYTSRNNQKTHDLLIRSLELTNRDNINTEVFKTLASTTYQMKRKEHAYIWAIVANQFGVPIASESELHLLYGFEKSKYKQLALEAEKLKDAIESGKFRRDQLSDY